MKAPRVNKNVLYSLSPENGTIVHIEEDIKAKRITLPVFFREISFI